MIVVKLETAVAAHLFATCLKAKNNKSKQACADYPASKCL